MDIQKLPLAQRLERMKTGLSPYPEFSAAAIRAMAHMPIAVYLKDYEEQRSRLKAILKLSAPKMEQITYEEIATEIGNLRLKPGEAQNAADAARLLAAPLVTYFQEQLRRAGQYG